MTIVINRDLIERELDPAQTIALLEAALLNEAAGATSVSPKFITDLGTGAMRILVAADQKAGFFATKAYHEIDGIGVRYVVSLYDLKSGALLALLDGRPITDLRTGAASGVAARRLDIPQSAKVGIVGSGRQARAQLKSLAAVLNIEQVSVYSPTQANREAFARDMGHEHGFTVEAVEDIQAAVVGKDVVATASAARDSEPLLKPEWLGACRLLCAVGNTRPQYAEVAPRTFAEASQVIVDSRHAIAEAGDLIRAREANVLPDENVATLAEIVSGTRSVAKDGLVIFKSVGTALQDLALAQELYLRFKTSSEVPSVEFANLDGM